MIIPTAQERLPEDTAIDGREAADDRISGIIAVAARELAERSPALATLFSRDELRAVTLGTLADAVRRHLSERKERDPERTSLSDRELQVVALIVEGLSNKEISRRLELSDKTVKNHISHILAKLRLNARTQIAVLALRNGFANGVPAITRR